MLSCQYSRLASLRRLLTAYNAYGQLGQVLKSFEVEVPPELLQEALLPWVRCLRELGWWMLRVHGAATCRFWGPTNCCNLELAKDMVQTTCQVQ